MIEIDKLHGVIFELNTDITAIITVHNDYEVEETLNSFEFVDNSDDLDDGVLLITSSYRILPIGQTVYSEWSAFETFTDTINKVNALDELIADKYQLRFEFKYVPNDDDITYTMTDIKVNDVLVDRECIEVALNYNSNRVVVSESKNLFNPYENTEGSVRMWLDMVDKTNEMIGWECVYFKVETDLESKDNTFKTYNSYTLSSAKYLKMLRPENTFIDTIHYLEAKHTYDTEIEMHITIENFKRVFGIDASPEPLDYVYIPRINKVYDISAVKYSEDDYMNVNGWWVVSIKKHVYRDDISEHNILKVGTDEDPNTNETDFDINKFRSFNIEMLSKSDSTMFNNTDEIDRRNTPQFDNTQFSYQFTVDPIKSMENDYTITPIIEYERLRQLANDKIIFNTDRLCVGWSKFSGRQYAFNKIPRSKYSIVYQQELPLENITTMFWFNITTDKLKTSQNIVKLGQYGTIVFKPNAKRDKGKLYIVANDGTNEKVISNIEIDVQKWHFFNIQINKETSKMTVKLTELNNTNGWVLSHVYDVYAPYTYTIDPNFDKLAFYGGKYSITNIRVYEGLISSHDAITQGVLINESIKQEPILTDNVTDLPKIN